MTDEQLRKDTALAIENHIERVQTKVGYIAATAIDQARGHDQSKFEPVEFEPLVAMKRLERDEGKVEFGTPDYKARTDMLGPMISEHYSKNPHHPEHWPEGISGMDLITVIEMLCDWSAAAAERDPSGTMNITFCVEKYGIPPMLENILRNTADRMNWKHK